MGQPKIPKKYIRRLNINGMNGRALELPRPKKNSRDILFIYGHHANIERMYTIAQSLNQEAGVIMPDLPGFGGMDTMYSIGMQPTLDNLADYLAAYIKLRFPNRRHFSIAGFSYGFVVATRLLQKYPDLANQVDFVISVAGFSDASDFKFRRRNYAFLKHASRLLSRRMPGWIVKHVILRKTLISTTYNLAAKTNPKMNTITKAQRPEMIDFEVVLWQCNDARTYMKTGHSMLTLHLPGEKINLPVHHVEVSGEQYFDGERVARNMKRLYKKVVIHRAQMDAHMPTIIEDVEVAGRVMPPSIRKLIGR